MVVFFLFRFGVSGFPTIKFFPKNNKEGEEVNICCIIYSLRSNCMTLGKNLKNFQGKVLFVYIKSCTFLVN